MTATEGDLRAVDVAWEEVKRCTSNKSSEPPHSRKKLLNGPMGYVSRPKVALNDVHVDRQQNPKANIGSVDVGDREGAQSKPFVDFKGHWWPQSVISSVQSTNDHHHSLVRVYIGVEDVDAHTVKAFQHIHLVLSVSNRLQAKG